MNTDENEYWVRRVADEELLIARARTPEAAIIHQELRDRYLRLVAPRRGKLSFVTPHAGD